LLLPLSLAEQFSLAGGDGSFSLAGGDGSFSHEHVPLLHYGALHLNNLAATVRTFWLASMSGHGAARSN
jgi:hypothetical protein